MDHVISVARSGRDIPLELADVFILIHLFYGM
jgi:hypothetical protein